MFVTSDTKSHSRKISPRSIMQKVPDIVDLYNQKWNVSIADFKVQTNTKQRGRSRPFLDIKLNLRKGNITHNKNNLRNLNFTEQKLK